jgi:pyrroline-5-carboxylate reductase
MKIGCIGVGNMGSAILRGILARGFAAAADIHAYDKDEAKLRAFADETGIETASSNLDVVLRSEAILLAVKPNDLSALLASISGEVLAEKPLLLSIATGTSLASIAGWLGDDAKAVPIVRIIPNVNVQVGAGLAGYCPNEAVSEAQAAWAEAFFSSIGLAIRIDEDKFSVFQAVGCASPAWAFLFIQGLALGGVKKGLSKQQATLAAAQSVMGSAKLVLESGRHPAALVDTVCSPGGTTIVGVSTLEEGGFSGLLMKAVENCHDRDQEILAQK